MKIDYFCFSVPICSAGLEASNLLVDEIVNQNNNNNITEIKIKEIDVQNKKRKLGNIKYGSI